MLFGPCAADSPPPNEHKDTRMLIHNASQGSLGVIQYTLSILKRNENWSEAPAATVSGHRYAKALLIL